jgi:predicted metal-binding membrane protein
LISIRVIIKSRSVRKMSLRLPSLAGTGYMIIWLSFGLTNAPAHLMYLMNSVFMPELDKFVAVFIDDILIYTKSEEEYAQHL